MCQACVRHVFVDCLKCVECFWPYGNLILFIKNIKGYLSGNEKLCL